MTSLYTMFPSPIGNLLLTGTETHLTGLYIRDDPAPAPGAAWVRDDERFVDERSQLHEYFEGRRKDFDVRLELRGTDFQRAVWRALRDIPYGCTASYGRLANLVGRPRAARAVGAANGSNPIAIIVPCHRVIGGNGGICGYAGGVERKQQLLALEGGSIRGLAATT